ncbi:RNA polymerase sigma factor [Micromonospora sagamiensis]|uniref:RNA polymerase sigma-70 factor (ECF subfamily) n=1 Tax=Micromonospora sagamiensis TaxID=47875 RepID=A0A562WEE1_9ACTN|nr:sigma-70 family RNA polymerase sigma factor [Micromonospora sagamiensis]TWJ28650.1 RNA polymerase sigma-70 factor (ECF subfamily) [Micromonospora sagamiensis]BCL12445.1 DNA-directed RNA polymerase sigma-70 factor [Micromonospora sagamiensis]
MEEDDRARFVELFRRHYGAVMRYAARRVGSDRAPDVVSETFLVAWRRLSDVPVADPLPWLYATARHLIGNEIRGRSRQARLTSRMGEVVEMVAADHADVVVDQVRVRRALAELPERDQEALRLAAWEGLDASAAARAMGCSRTAYKVRLYRARTRLAAALEPTQAQKPADAALLPLAHEGGS